MLDEDPVSGPLTSPSGTRRSPDRTRKAAAHRRPRITAKQAPIDQPAGPVQNSSIDCGSTALQSIAASVNTGGRRTAIKSYFAPFPA
jgi:hypothetical protein